MSVIAHREFTCTEPDCGFTTADTALMRDHDCQVEYFGGHCEDFPCCGHEFGDCNGQLYGSDEVIKQQVYDRMNDPDFDPYYDDPDF